MPLHQGDADMEESVYPATPRELAQKREELAPEILRAVRALASARSPTARCRRKRRR
jgi:hypothetical protein